MAPPMPPMQEVFLLRAIYPIFSFIICMLIYLKTKEIEKLSLNKGVKYFRRAFLFLGISFPIMFLLMSARVFIGSDVGLEGLGREGFRETPGIPLGILISRYFLLVSSFYLLYSLVWKRFEKKNGWLRGEGELVIHAAAIILTLSEILIGPFPGTVILTGILAYITVLSYSNYTKSKKKMKSVPWYSVSILLFSLMWLIQSVAILLREFSHVFRLYTMVSTPVILVIILYLVHKATKRK